jgi:hypothetical protein
MLKKAPQGIKPTKQTQGKKACAMFGKQMHYSFTG